MNTKKSKTTSEKPAKAKKAPKANPVDVAPVAAPPASAEAPAPTATTPKLSALDAAAKVLGERGEAMSTKELIGMMAVQGYWSSPAGKTPASTLYAAMTKEIASKGDQSRFKKVGHGRFALNATV